ncbi:MAG: TonB-dependent receptor [Sphingomonadaceae bacterium]
MIAGLEGSIGDNWQWDVSYQYGQAADDIQTPNLLRGKNFKNALDVIADPVTGDPVCRDAAARAGGCVPYNIWSRGPLTQAQRDYFVATRVQNTRNSQKIISAHLNGDLFRLPAGAVAFAAGADRRVEGLRTQDDAAMLSGDIRWGVGTNANARPALDERFKVTEGYAEVLVPIIYNTPFVDMLSVNGAIRLSDYNTIGSTVAWQAGVNWMVNDDLRLRFSRSRSVRAPNLQELFGPVTVTLTSVGNPCGSNNIDTTANRKANCIALGASASGGPVTVPQIEAISGGNSQLAEETSNSLTIGAVLTPRAVPGLRLSVDYYDIRISGVITSPDLNKGCLDAASMAGNSFCERMEFTSEGLLVRQNRSLINASEFSSTGVDFSVDYRLPVGQNSRVGINLVGTYLIKKEILGVGGDASTLSIEDGEYTDPRLRFTLRVDFDTPHWGVGVANRFISKSDIDRQALPEPVNFPKCHREYIRT